MGAKHAEIQRVRCGQCTDSHHGRYGGNAGLFHKCPQFLLRMRRKHAAARAEHRSLGALNCLCCFAQLKGMPLTARLVADDVGWFAVIEIRDVFLLHIDRHVDEHRSRPTSSGDIKGFLENLRNIRSVFNYVAVFGKRLRCAGDVRLLENVTSEQIAAHLPCDHHQGNGIHMCRGDAGDQVGSAGTGGGNTYATLPETRAYPLRA